jgi:hypothetical protein
VTMSEMNDGQGISGNDLRDLHPRLDEADALLHCPAPEKTED